MRERVLLTVQSPYAEHNVVVRVSLCCHTVGCLKEAAEGSMQCVRAIRTLCVWAMWHRVLPWSCREIWLDSPEHWLSPNLRTFYIGIMEKNGNYDLRVI